MCFIRIHLCALSQYMDVFLSTFLMYMYTTIIDLPIVELC